MFPVTTPEFRPKPPKPAEGKYAQELDVETAEKYLSEYQRRLATLEGDANVQEKIRAMSRFAKKEWRERGVLANETAAFSAALEQEKDHVRKRLAQCERTLAQEPAGV